MKLEGKPRSWYLARPVGGFGGGPADDGLGVLGFDDDVVDFGDAGVERGHLDGAHARSAVVGDREEVAIAGPDLSGGRGVGVGHEAEQSAEGAGLAGGAEVEGDGGRFAVGLDRDADRREAGGVGIGEFDGGDRGESISRSSSSVGTPVEAGARKPRTRRRMSVRVLGASPSTGIVSKGKEKKTTRPAPFSPVRG